MVVLVVRLVFIVLGLVGGRELGNLVRTDFLNTHSFFYQQAGYVVAIVVCGLLGFVIGGVAGRYVAKLLNRFEHALQHVSASDVIFGIIGILVGFLVAFLPSIVMFRSYPGWIVALVLFAICGILGYIIAVSKKDDFLDLLRAGRYSAALNPHEGLRQRTKVLDTSTIIDGRISDVTSSGFLQGELLVPRFVLNELQAIADSDDPLKRARGRRGLDVLSNLQRQERVEVLIEDQDFPEFVEVDSKLVKLAKTIDAPIITNDFNLNKIAELQGVAVLNINDLASALKPVVLPGEGISLRVLREGKEGGQGVGYLEDGTMVVVEGGRRHIGRDVDVVVSSVIQTPAGRMIFAALREKTV